jgi:hypothetical protein
MGTITCYSLDGLGLESQCGHQISCAVGKEARARPSWTLVGEILGARIAWLV